MDVKNVAKSQNKFFDCWVNVTIGDKIGRKIRTHTKNRIL